MAFANFDEQTQDIKIPLKTAETSGENLHLNSSICSLLFVYRITVLLSENIYNTILAMRWLLLTFLLFSTYLISEAPERQSRKLMMTHNVSTTTTAKNEANKSHNPNSDRSKSSKGSEDEHLSVKRPSISKERHYSTDTKGQEKLDIVQMDYTLARRKPHIHN